jgi:hypothetical protein
MTVREWTEDELSRCDAIKRRARKTWACICANPDGPNYLESCTRRPIFPGDIYIENMDFAAAYQSGSRYHLACWDAHWGPPERWAT